MSSGTAVLGVQTDVDDSAGRVLARKAMTRVARDFRALRQSRRLYSEASKRGQQETC